MKSERFDIHQHITDRIITAIERGAGDSACRGTVPPVTSCAPSMALPKSPVAA
jgi:hypothetical protein